MTGKSIPLGGHSLYEGSETVTLKMALPEERDVEGLSSIPKVESWALIGPF